MKIAKSMRAERAVRMIPSNGIEWTGSGSRRVKVLFEARSSLRLTLERWAPASRIERDLPVGWEEIFLFEGGLREQGCQGPRHVLLPPGSTGVLLAGGAGCQLVRLSHDDRRPGASRIKAGFRDQDARVPVGARSYGEFLWNPIPARRPKDALARTAELSRSQSGEFVTTLLEAKAGWFLPEHEHPVDVASYCLSGDGVLAVGAAEHPRVAHQLALIPSGTRHSFRAGPEGAVLLIFVLGERPAGGSGAR